MTEYELSYLLSQYRAAIGWNITQYMTAVFAMLMAAYFAAAQLEKFTSRLLVGIFSLFSLMTSVPISQSVFDYVALLSVVHDYSIEHPKSLVASLARNSPSSVWSHVMMLGMLSSVLVATFFGTLLFYFSCRKKGA